MYAGEKLLILSVNKRYLLNPLAFIFHNLFKLNSSLHFKTDLNQFSLFAEKFLKLEEEKKEKRQVKKVDKGPQITFKSFTTNSSSATFGADPNSMHEYTDFSIRSLTSPGFGDLQTDSR